MVKIKDADEKKMIIAYYKMCSNKAARNLLCNNSIHATWIMRWRDDFVVNGKCLKMWHQKFVVSANKSRQGIEPPEYYNEYNEFINDVASWINENFDLNAGRKNNRRKFAEFLVVHREKCANELIEILNRSGSLSDCRLIYKLPDRNSKGFTELMKYSIAHNGTNVFTGSCDETRAFIANTDKLIEEKLYQKK